MKLMQYYKRHKETYWNDHFRYSMYLYPLAYNAPYVTDIGEFNEKT